MIKKIHFPLSGVAAALALISSPVALAQDNSATQLEELVVTGIRGSLKSAADIRRNESGVVDAISAEDIGKFPDANLAESLQRITGVSIDRQNNEGNQISVRGLGPSFNLVTLNGRQMPVASSPLVEDGGFDQSRAFNFAEIASDSVAGVDVFKTARPDKPSGGIGATVDIRTARPFDFDAGDSEVIISAAGIVDLSLDDEVTPEVGGFFAHNFNDVVAFMVSGSFSERRFLQIEDFTDSINVVEPGDVEFDNLEAAGFVDSAVNSVIFSPFTFGTRVNDSERTRINGQAVFQVRPTENFTITADYTGSRFDVDLNQSVAQFFGDLAFPPIIANGQSPLLDDLGNEVLDDEGEVVMIPNPLGTAAAANVTAFEVDENGTLTQFGINALGDRGIDAVNAFNQTVIENDSVGLTFQLEFDKISLELDLHSSSSVSSPNGESNDNFASFQGPLNLEFFANLGDGIPEVTLGGIATRGAGQFNGGDPLDGVDGFQDSDGFSNLGQGIRSIGIDNQVTQAQFRASWRGNEGDVLSSIDFGASFTEYDVETSSVLTGFVFNGLFPCNSPVPEFNICGALDFENIGTSGGSIFPEVTTFSGPDALATFAEVGANIMADPDAGGAALGFIGVPDDDFFFLGDFSDEQLQASSNTIVEESLSFYVNTNWEAEFNGWPVELAAGFRVESTDVESSGVTEFPLAITVLGPIEANVVNSEEVEPFSQDGGYTEFLPAVDFQIQPSDTTVLRLSYGRTLARPDIATLRPNLTIDNVNTGGPFIASVGNPDLSPFIADNIDAAFEYYYSDTSFFAATYFHKNVENFIGTSATQVPILDPNGNPITDPSARFVDVGDDPVLDPGSGPVTSLPSDPVILFDVIENVNSDSATIDGIELAIQHVFGDSGFGFQANYTFVDSSAEFDPFSLEQEETALIGLSDTANLVGFYENDNFEIRIAANWRDEFLAATNQIRVDEQPLFVEEFVQVDASASYILNDNVSIFLEGLNLTGEDQGQFGRFSNQFLFEDNQDPRFTLGVRVKF